MKRLVNLFLMLFLATQLYGVHTYKFQHRYSDVFTTLVYTSEGGTQLCSLGYINNIGTKEVNWPTRLTSVYVEIRWRVSGILETSGVLTLPADKLTVLGENLVNVEWFPEVKVTFPTQKVWPSNGRIDIMYNSEYTGPSRNIVSYYIRDSDGNNCPPLDEAYIYKDFCSALQYNELFSIGVNGRNVIYTNDPNGYKFLFPLKLYEQKLETGGYTQVIPSSSARVCGQRLRFIVDATGGAKDYYVSNNTSTDPAITSMKLLFSNATGIKDFNMSLLASLGLDLSLPVVFAFTTAGSTERISDYLRPLHFYNVPDLLISPAATCADENKGTLQVTYPNEAATNFQYYVEIPDKGNAFIGTKTVNGQPHTPNYTFTNLPTGTATLTIIATAYSDGGNLCYIPRNYTITARPIPTISVTVTDSTPSCNARTDAQLSISRTNSTSPNYTFFFSDGVSSYTTGNNNTSFNFNVPGNGNKYKVAIQDSRGCNDTIETLQKIKKYEPLGATAAVVQPACFGGNGTLTVSPSGGISNHTQFQYSLDGNNWQDSPTFSRPQGNFNISIRDKSDLTCNSLNANSVTMGQPTEIAISTLKTNISCNGGNNGTIAYTLSGGTNPLVPSIMPTNGTHNSSNRRFENLPSGTYSITVTDKNLCTKTVNNIVLIHPPAISPGSITPVIESCPNTGDGDMLITPSGGVPGYVFEWKNSSGSIVSTSEDLIDKPGNTNYTLKIVDYNGCIYTSSSLFLPLANPITFSLSPSPPSCQYTSDGTLTVVNPVNGQAPYRYSLNGSALNNLPADRIIRDLPDGSYNLVLYDSRYNPSTSFNACKSGLKNSTITDKALPVVTPTVTHIGCHGQATGSIHVTLSGVDSPMADVWYDTLNQVVGTGNVLSNRPAGRYILKVTDNKGCSTMVNTIPRISQPPLLRLTGLAPTIASCEEVGDATLTISASGGTLPLNYQINGTDYGSQSVIPNLSAGPTQVRVSDKNLCQKDTTISIVAGLVLLNIDSVAAVKCHGQPTGFFSVSAFGGKDSYQYNAYLPGFGNSVNSFGSFSNQSSGVYRVSARDNLTTCSSDTLLVEVSQPEELQLLVSSIDSAACNKPLGKIAYSASGGTGIYSFGLFNAARGLERYPDSLTAGNYLLRVKDINLCGDSLWVSVPDRPAPQIDGFDLLDSAYCDKPLARLRLHVTGGSPDFVYTINQSRIVHSNLIDGLAAGNYEVMVQDRYNCQNHYTFALNNGSPLNVITYSQEAACNQSDGSLELRVSGGVAPYLFVWPPSVASDTTSNYIATNLSAGLYPVDVIDRVGCVQPIHATISNANGPSIDGLTYDKPWCGLAVGSAQVMAQGGMRPYSYQWFRQGSGTNIGADSLISGLAAGSYQVQVSDAGSCLVFAALELTDSLELEPTFNLVSTDSAACGKKLGIAEVAMNGGLSPYTITWSDGTPGTRHAALAAGKHRVSALDSRGCMQNMDIQIFDKKLPVASLLQLEPDYCNHANGSVELLAQLGTPPYYSILSANAFSQTETLVLDQQGYVAQHDSLIGSAAPYQLEVFDANGCRTTPLYLLIGQENPMQIQLVDLNPVSCYGLSNGSATVMANGGKLPYRYTWNGVNNNTSAHSALPAGNVVVQVSDSLNCSRELSFKVFQPQPLVLSYSFNNEPDCYGWHNGSIYAFANGGTGNISYIWNHADTLQRLTDLAAGNHALELVDAKGCRKEYTITLEQPARVTDTELPEEQTLCSGQTMQLDPGMDFSGGNWTSLNGYYSQGEVAEVGEAGKYFYSGYTLLGCEVRDTFTLKISDNLLNAEFLMVSEATTLDTVALIEVSWPQPESVSWSFPEQAAIVMEEGAFTYLGFDTAGTYYVELTSYLAGCLSVQGKYIEIYDAYPQKNAMDAQNKGSRSMFKNLNMYPNPVREFITLEIELQTTSDLRLELINISGKQVIQSINEKGQDSYQLTIDVRHLKEGNYLLRAIAAGQVETKMIVIR